MWRETDRFLESLAMSVREGKRVMEASQFARWLNFSGLVSLLKENKAPSPLLCDGVGLQKKLDDLLYECGELFRGGKHDPKYAASDIAEINRKLDLLIGGKIAIAQPGDAETSTRKRKTSEESRESETQFAVIPGGLDDGESHLMMGKGHVAEVHRKRTEAVA